MKNTITKIITLALAVLMLFSFAACNTTNNDEGSASSSGTETSGTSSNNDKVSVALDLTKEWEAVNGKNTLVQGCLVVNTKFADEHPAEVAQFLKDYEASVNFISAGSDEAIAMITDEKIKILPNANIAKKALPNCNICFIDGMDMKPLMTTFCEKLHDYNEKSVSAVPNDDFYYVSDADASAADKDLEIKVYALNGTTALGMAQMISKSNDGTDTMNYNFSLHASADAITGAVVSGECAIAALPTNAAANLFNKTGGKIKLLAINTLGVLYVLQRGDNGVEKLADLKGETIYLPGAGTNPEFITAALVESAGLEIGKDIYLDTTSYTSPDELQAAVIAGKVKFAVLPEPKVTVTIIQSAAK